MKLYNPNERIQLYRPVHEFLNLIAKEVENDIESGVFEDIIIDSPTSRNQRLIITRLPDPAERLLILSLTAKEMIDKKKTDERNVLFSLSRIPQFIFPNFSEDNVDLFSQADITEVLDFVKMFKEVFAASPRFLEAQSYDAASILFQWVNRSEVRGRRTLKMALMNVKDFPGVTGLTSFDETGDVNKQIYLLEIRGRDFEQIRP